MSAGDAAHNDALRGVAPNVERDIPPSGVTDPDECGCIAASSIRRNLGTGTQTEWRIPLCQSLSESITK